MTERPLHILALAKKRYLKLAPRPDGTGFEVVDWTEHAAGGIIPPPGFEGRGEGRHHVFMRPVAVHALAVALARDEGLPDPPFVAPWDAPGEAPFPVLRRFAAGSPRTLAGLPKGLGAHPFAPILEGEPDRAYTTSRSPLALDPGSYANWASFDWWVDTQPTSVTTTGVAAQGVVPLLPVREYFARWARPVPADHDKDELDVRVVRRVGRSGALVDARFADPRARASDHQVVYDEGGPALFVVEEIRRLGPARFSPRYGVPMRTVRGIASGREPSAVTVDRVSRAARTVDETTAPLCRGRRVPPCGRPPGRAARWSAAAVVRPPVQGGRASPQPRHPSPPRHRRPAAVSEASGAPPARRPRRRSRCPVAQGTALVPELWAHLRRVGRDERALRAGAVSTSRWHGERDPVAGTDRPRRGPVSVP